MAEGKEESAAQLSGLWSKHSSKYLSHSLRCSTVSSLEAVVWWEGLHTDCWPEVVWVISFQILGPRSYRHIPGAHKALRQPGVWGCVTSRSSVLKTRLLQTPLLGGGQKPGLLLRCQYLTLISCDVLSPKD